MNKFRIINNNYMLEYSIEYSDNYESFMEKINEKYSIKNNYSFKNLIKNDLGEITELRNYDKVINLKETNDYPIYHDNQKKVDIKFEGINYPFIYKYLKDGFSIIYIPILERWVNEKEKEVINSENFEKNFSEYNITPMYIRYNSDNQIKNKEELLKAYFSLINFKLVNKIKIDDYNKILKIDDTELLENLQRVLDDAKENTDLIYSSQFCDILTDKLLISSKKKVYTK